MPFSPVTYNNIVDDYTNACTLLQQAVQDISACQDIILQTNAPGTIVDLLIPFMKSAQICSQILLNTDQIISAVGALQNYAVFSGNYPNIDAYYNDTGILINNTWAQLSTDAGYPIDLNYEKQQVENASGQLVNPLTEQTLSLFATTVPELTVLPNPVMSGVLTLTSPGYAALPSQPCLRVRVGANINSNGTVANLGPIKVGLPNGAQIPLMPSNFKGYTIDCSNASDIEIETFFADDGVWYEVTAANVNNPQVQNASLAKINPATDDTLSSLLSPASILESPVDLILAGTLILSSPGSNTLPAQPCSYIRIGALINDNGTNGNTSIVTIGLSNGTKIPLMPNNKTGYSLTCKDASQLQITTVSSNDGVWYSCFGKPTAIAQCWHDLDANLTRKTS